MDIRSDINTDSCSFPSGQGYDEVRIIYWRWQRGDEALGGHRLCDTNWLGRDSPVNELVE